MLRVATAQCAQTVFLGKVLSVEESIWILGLEMVDSMVKISKEYNKMVFMFLG